MEQKVKWSVLGAVLVLALGYFDYVSGPTISFSLFYLLPIALATWFAGRATGYGVSLLSVLVWLSAELKSDLPFSHFLIPYWNAVVRLGVFLIFTWLLAGWSRLSKEMEKTVRERTAELSREVTERLKTERQLQQQRDELALHSRLLSAGLMQSDFNERLRAILREVLASTRAEIAGIHLVGDDTLWLKQLNSIAAKSADGFRQVTLDELPAYFRQPYFARVESLPPGEMAAIAGPENFIAHVCVPLYRPSDSRAKTGNWIGTLFVATRRQGALNEQEAIFLRNASPQIALLIEDARRFSENQPA